MVLVNAGSNASISSTSSTSRAGVEDTMCVDFDHLRPCPWHIGSYLRSLRLRPAEEGVVRDGAAASEAGEVGERADLHVKWRSTLLEELEFEWDLRPEAEVCCCGG